MQEIGLESTLLNQVLLGKKTIEGRLGKPRFLKLKVGDRLKLREDVWKDGDIVNSIHDRAVIRITQILYFMSFREMLESVDYEAVLPGVASIDEAVAEYRKFYTPEDEYEYGVVAMVFEVV